jgi:hypothetical protein
MFIQKVCNTAGHSLDRTPTISNGQQSDNCNGSAAEPIDGISLLGSKQSRYKCSKRLPQGTQKGTTVMTPTSPTLGFSNWPACRFIAGTLAIIIFAIDTFIPFDIAIAVLYVIVVLMAANSLRRRGVILVSLACVALTVLSYMLQHGYSDGSESIGRCLVSLTAICITTILSLERQRSEDARRRSETYLAKINALAEPAVSVVRSPPKNNIGRRKYSAFMSMTLQRSQRLILCAGAAILMMQHSCSKPLNRRPAGHKTSI